jgi:hypothetical protein
MISNRSASTPVSGWRFWYSLPVNQRLSRPSAAGAHTLSWAEHMGATGTTILGSCLGCTTPSRTRGTRPGRARLLVMRQYFDDHGSADVAQRPCPFKHLHRILILNLGVDLP